MKFRLWIFPILRIKSFTFNVYFQFWNKVQKFVLSLNWWIDETITWTRTAQLSHVCLFHSECSMSKMYLKSSGPDWNNEKSNLNLKFIYSEKATKFCAISTLLLSYVVPVKRRFRTILWPSQNEIWIIWKFNF